MQVTLALNNDSHQYARGGGWFKRPDRGRLALMTESDQQRANLVANVKAARTMRGWSQADLVNRLNELDADTNQSAISRLEKGEREPRFSELTALLDLFGVTLDALTGDPEAFLNMAGWAKARASYLGARTRIRSGCVDYEEAAQQLWGLIANRQVPNGVPKEEVQELRDGVEKSGAVIAQEWYEHLSPRLGAWRASARTPGDDDGQH